MNNDSKPQHSATSHNLGGTSMARNGHPAGNGDSPTASPRGGWTPSRASWLGMAAVVLLAVAVLSIATVVAGRASPSDAATLDASAAGEVATSSTIASPTAIASSWSMGPAPLRSDLDVKALSSGTDVSPVRATSSVVSAPR